MTDRNIPVEALRGACEQLLGAAGVPYEVVIEVVDHLIESSLWGFDSHGVARIPYYLNLLEKGTWAPNGEVAVCKDTENLTTIDGGGGFGIPAMRLAARMTAEKVASTGMAVAAVTNVGHTGRIGEYADRLASAGCFAFVTGGGGHKLYRNVVPHGGRKGVFSTNPIALAFPENDRYNVVVDFATSAVAGGKVMLAKNAGKTLAQGLIVDNEGRASTDPDDYYAGGALLPAAAHKGYGLGLMAEILGYGLLGETVEFNWVMMAFNITLFGSREDITARTEEYLAMVQSSPPADGFDRVMTPGQMEREKREQRQRNGIPLPVEECQAFEMWAERLNVSLNGFV